MLDNRSGTGRQSLETPSVLAFRRISDIGSGEACKDAIEYGCGGVRKTWLLTIADTGWRPEGGERVAEIGPLPVIAGETYAVQYMEAVFAPGMTAPSHTHAGPEAWYTLSGETCLETPDGKQVGRAGGEPVIIPGGPPMHLTATGTERRRALVLILHEATSHPRRQRITGRPGAVQKLTRSSRCSARHRRPSGATGPEGRIRIRSFDHLVGSSEECGRDFDTDGFGSS